MNITIEEINNYMAEKMKKVKFRYIKNLHIQILLVILAFLLMVISSYFVARNMERRHLERQIEDTFISIEALLKADLKEFETMLSVVSGTIRSMLLRGIELDSIKAYMVDITNNILQEEQNPGFFGFFAGFGEDGLNGFNALHPNADWDEIIASGYVVQERPWYIAANTSENKIVLTDPYVDEITKEVTFTYVHNIFDNDGKRLGIICLDVLLDRIYRFSMENRNNEAGFWTLHDKNHVIIAHPNTEFLGKKFRDVDSGFTIFADELEQQGFITNRFARNYLGMSALFSMRPLDTGWYLGIMAYTDNYSSNMKIVLIFLACLGILLPTGLIIILIRINYAKEQSEKRVQRAVQEKKVLENLNHVLNGIDAMICVTDPETDKLLFINDCMREMFNIGPNVEDQICYKALRNFDSRCSFCPCNKLSLEPDKEIIWEQVHSESNRVFRSFSKFIKWPNGKNVHIQHAVDITDFKNITNTLNKKFEQQSLMMRISQSFFSGGDMNTLLTNALKEVAEFMGISQLLLYRTTEDEHIIFCQNGWIDPKYNLKSRVGGTIVLSDTLLNVFKSLNNQEKFYITCNDPDMREIMAPYRINFHNFLTASIFIEGKLYAALDFSRPEQKLWSQDEIEIASFASNILAGILQKHEMEERLIHAKESAENSSRYKTDFLARMSHEIRTPMNAILGITEIQLRNENIPPEMEEGLEKVYDSGTLLLNIINDILDLSKIEAGKMEIIPLKYDIPSLINDTVQINRLRYDSKPIDFFLDVDENTPLSMIGDELRIRQILGNILSNAFKYTSKGEVKLSVYTKPLQQQDEVMLVFRISDTGQGMTEDQLNILFDEYTRFNMDINRTIMGTGLGMSITKKLVDLMNGEIVVESEVYKGSIFTVKIPQKRIDGLVCGKDLADKLSTFQFQSASMSKKSRMLREYMPYGKVLIVDDIESNIYVTKGMLLPYGLNIDTANSGFEVVEKVRAGNKYDIIFMDHMMPVMDGIEAARIIREWEKKQSQTPMTIIALTANALVGQAEIFLEKGFNSYISKPIDSRELNRILNEYIRNKKPPEVVKAARREQRKEEKKPGYEPSLQKNSEVEKFFIMDAESAISVLEGIEIKKITNTQIDSYEITVHGMKSALLNIGEQELSDTALRLEKAAKNKDIEFLDKETRFFINALKALIEKFNKKFNENSNENSKTAFASLSELKDSEDAAFLYEKLSEIEKACADLNPNEIKNALNELSGRKWINVSKEQKREIDDILDEINVHLLHSSFKKAAQAAKSVMEAIK